MSSSSSRSSSRSSGSSRSSSSDGDAIVEIEPDYYICEGDGVAPDEGVNANEDARDEGVNANEDAGATIMNKWLDDQLQASVFYEEPVRHITFYIMFVSESGILERVESRVVELAEPNVVDRFLIGRIVKHARLTASGIISFRLNSMFVYNVHVELQQLAKYVRNPETFLFFQAITSLNDIVIKPTLACFHSLNSVHIVLRRTHTATATATGTRVVHITPDAMSTTRQRHYTRRNIIKNKK